MKKLCLFDASGYIHRAFHAIPLLTTSKGEPINAVYGFSRMISKVLKEEKPDFVGICFDTPAPTFRHKEYADYKANRSEIDVSLVSQLPLSENLANAWGLPCLKKDGYEADDLIATLARYGADNNWEVLILSGDKDILQLVDKNISVRDEIKKVTYNEAKVQERYGLTPHQLVDYFCLTGDKVDNVAGVPGVGDKTATKLLSKYGSIEGIFSDLDKEAPPLKEKLLIHQDRVIKNRLLIRLDVAVPIQVTPSLLTVRTPDQKKLGELLSRLEFKSDLFGVGAIDDPQLELNKTRKVHVVLSAAEMDRLSQKLTSAKRLAYDIETDSLDKYSCRLVGISFSFERDEAWYIPVAHDYIGAPKQIPFSHVNDLLKKVMADPNVLKCGQNLKFDNTVLARFGMIPQGPFFDTMIAAYCIDPSRNSFGLKDLAAVFLKEKMTRFTDLFENAKDLHFNTVPIEKAAPYAAADAEVTYRLVELFSKKLKELNLEHLFNDLEMPLVRIVQEMEAAGIAIDVNHLKRIKDDFQERRNKIEQEIFSLAGEEFVLNSPKQLSRILFEKLKLPPVKKTKTGFSTDEEVLLKLAVNHPICDKIIACRELNKLISTYVESLLSMVNTDSERIHTTFHQTGTITGRLSSTDPNLQNIPIRTENGKEIRKAFIPARGNILLSADYSQIDLRSLAHMSEDPVLIETFKAGGDIHTATAAEIFHVTANDVTPEMRRSAKAINFGVVYGQQAYALSQSLGIGFEKAQEFITNYFERYAGVRAWMADTLMEARKTGMVRTLSGRRRSLPDINSKNAYIRSFAERVAINTPIQGSSADIIKFAMIRVFEELHRAGLGTKMLLQVHDELVFDVPLKEIDMVSRLVRSGMENAFVLRVPLVVDIKTGPNWNDMKKLVLTKSEQ